MVLSVELIGFETLKKSGHPGQDGKVHRVHRYLVFLNYFHGCCKKAAGASFVNRAQEKTHSVEKNRVETQVTTVKVFWSLYEGGYVYQKKEKGKKITVAMILQNAQDWSAQIIIHQMHLKALWGIPQEK